ncbi:MAG: glycosyltransferase, partial [Planctomycetota bacterium]
RRAAPTIADTSRNTPAAPTEPRMRIAYLAPEFPGQTHTWKWRERNHLQELGFDVRMVSTRPPLDRDRARHDWAADAKAATTYLWPMPALAIARATLALLTIRLPALLACIGLCRRIHADGGPSTFSSLKLVIPAHTLATWINRTGIKHVHCATPAGSLITALLARKINPRFTVDCTVNANFDWWGGGLNAKFAEIDALFVIVGWMEEQARNDFSESITSKMHLARLGVDTREWQERTPPPAPPPFTIVTVGRLHPSKGHDDLIRAVASLRDNGRDVTLALLGEGPQRQELEQLAQSLGLGDAVEFTGSVPEHEVRARLEAAYAFVGASHAEPLGVVYIEAMALSVPTIGTDAKGPKEIIADGESGLLVPPKDHAALAAAIARLIDDPHLAAKLGKAGRARVIEQYDSRIGAKVVHDAIAALHKH